MKNILNVLVLTLVLSTVNIAGAWAGEWRASHNKFLNSWTVTNGEQMFKVTNEKSAKKSAKALNKAAKKAKKKETRNGGGNGFIEEDACHSPNAVHTC